MWRILARLGNLDPRWLYLAFVLSIAATAVLPIPLSVRLSPESRAYYEAIEGLDGRKPVLVQADWDQGTVGELRAQFINTVRHLFRKNLRVVFVSGIAAGPEFYEPVVEEIAKEYGKEYGRDWVSFGYKLAEPYDIAIEAIARDFRATVRTDRLGNPPQAYSWLQDTRTAADFALAVSIRYDEMRAYITYFYEGAGTPYIAGVATISSTPLYPFLSTGNIRGLLVGSRGGGEYEQAMGKREFGTRFLIGQSAGHLIVLIAIVLGNLGTWAARKVKAE